MTTGKAQPKTSPYSSSTTYSQQSSSPFQAYNRSTNYGDGTKLTETYSGGNTSPYGQAPKMPTSSTDGNWANYASDQRPANFTAQYGNMEGGYSSSPNTATRDAFIQSLNDQMTPYMSGQQKGPINFSPEKAWESAGKMVDQGWRNPFAAVSQQSFPSAYAPAGLPAAPPQSQEDIIRQFRQQRGSDPRQMMGRQRNRPPVYI